MITVYSKTTSFCGQCKATETTLERAGIDYEVIALEDLPAEMIEDFKNTIGTSAPIVITPNGSWSGFRPDLLAQIAA